MDIKYTSNLWECDLKFYDCEQVATLSNFFNNCCNSCRDKSESYHLGRSQSQLNTPTLVYLSKMSDFLEYTPLTINIALYNKLPEGFKHLAEMSEATRYLYSRNTLTPGDLSMYEDLLSDNIIYYLLVVSKARLVNLKLEGILLRPENHYLLPEYLLNLRTDDLNYKVDALWEGVRIVSSSHATSIVHYSKKALPLDWIGLGTHSYNNVTEYLYALERADLSDERLNQLKYYKEDFLKDNLYSEGLLILSKLVSRVKLLSLLEYPILELEERILDQLGIPNSHDWGLLDAYEGYLVTAYKPHLRGSNLTEMSRLIPSSILDPRTILYSILEDYLQTQNPESTLDLSWLSPILSRIDRFSWIDSILDHIFCNLRASVNVEFDSEELVERVKYSGNSSLLYARCIKRRFPEGEIEIFKDPIYRSSYSIIIKDSRDRNTIKL